MNREQKRLGLIVFIILIIFLGVLGLIAYINKGVASLEGTSGMKKFTSKNEGFSLLYPKDWALKDYSSTNCAYALVKGTSCREHFAFTAPDGLEINYFEGAANETLSPCGVQQKCIVENIRSISEINVPNYGKMYLIKTDKTSQADVPKGFVGVDYSTMYLHESLTPETMPKVGENIFDKFSIIYSIRSKFAPGERIFIEIFSTSGFDYLRKFGSEEFYNLPSVKQAEQILRSISY